jgi:hypothetical protein
LNDARREGHGKGAVEPNLSKIIPLAFVMIAGP